MTDMSRRTFTLAAGGALACAAFGASVQAMTQQQDAAAESLHFLDPELREGARLVQKTGPREGFNEKTLAAARASTPSSSESLVAQIPVSERRIPGRRGMPDVTTYLVNSDPNVMRPAILHTHGGGYILGSAKSDVPYLQNMARELDCVIVTVEYRLAPEATYRDSTEDTYTALAWSYANASQIGIDRTRIALLGESAGGGHAALLAQKARDRGEVPLVLQGLIYPMLDDRTGTTRKVAAPIGTIGWNAASNHFGWRSFLGREPGGTKMPKGAVPAREENLAGLAPAFIGVGAVDLFVHEDIEYARRLIDAAVPAELLVVPAAFHAFDFVVPNASVAKVFTKAKLNAFRRAFGQVINP
jgi:acetyl esterase/lipase